MKDQVHIGNTEAADLARQTALRERLAQWRRLLSHDRAHDGHPQIPIEALYDEATGLPR